MQECDFCNKIPDIIYCLEGQISLSRTAGLDEEEAEILRYQLHQSHERIWNYKLHLIKAYVQNWNFDIVHNARDESQATATQGKN